MTAQQAKQELHGSIQQTVQEAAPLDGGLLTKWVILAEFALPNGKMATARLTSDAGGLELRATEASGLLFEALFRKP